MKIKIMIVLFVFLEIISANSINFQKLLKTKESFSIAVLPFYNSSISHKVAFVFRKRLIKLLISKGYQIVNEQKLKKILSNPIYLKSKSNKNINFKELAKKISADAIMFGVLQKKDIQNSLLFEGKNFGATLILVDKNAKILWKSNMQQIENKKIAKTVKDYISFLDSKNTKKNRFVSF